MHQVTLKPRRDASLRRRHPWLFEGAIAAVGGEPRAGDTVDVMSAGGEWLARGAWSPNSLIRVRVLTFDRGETVDESLIARRVDRAVTQRERDPWLAGCSAYRLVNAESDGVPGFVADRYGDFLVIQCLSTAAERWKSALVEALLARTGCAGVYERSDGEMRAKEGLQPQVGAVAGPPLPVPLTVGEGPIRLRVDCRRGHKTGAYLDQRDNRLLVHELAADARVLNVFAYTGAFALHALAAGASSVTSVESSEEALELLTANLAENGFAAGRHESVRENAFEALRRFRDAGRRYDLAIVDPPKFVAAASQLKRGARGYKDVNLQALKLVEPGGWLMTFSCSGGVEPRLFQKIVADAALDAGRELSIVRLLGQASDHPVLASFPEAHYLKGLLARVW